MSTKRKDTPKSAGTATASRPALRTVPSPHGEQLRRNLETAVAASQRMLTATEQIEEFSRAVDAVIRCYRQGGRLYIAGNGGSAADAQHVAAEMVSRLAIARDPLPAESLTVDTSALTAIGNDFGFEEVFARQLEAKATPQDIFLAITTSGRSPNILRALERSRKLGVTSVVFSGGKGGPAKDLADFCITVPHDSTATIQEVQRVLYHTLCGCVESALFADSPRRDRG
jgi:D-sedoheptulose 7-phosphate isomerase